MRSIFDYYIGSLLVERQERSFDALSCEAIYGFNCNGTGKGNPEHIVLDGQQRLTAILRLWRPIPLPNRSNRALLPSR